MPVRRLICNAFLSLALVGMMVASEKMLTGEEIPAEQLDYREQLKPVPPRSPQAALKSFQVAEGFRIELAAAEPTVVDPVAMAFDADGRLFVIEMRGYSEDDGQDLGRVRLLEDTDDDGTYETSTIFADDFSWPTAITCTQGGVLVGAAPDLIFLKDTNGDGQADQRHVVFTGFGKSNVQGLLNTFQWGLDNRIHGVTSSSGAAVQKVVDGQATGETISLRGRDFSIHPLQWTLKPISGGGQHGMSCNDWGDKFTCSNSDHLQQIVYEDRYLARNPYVSPPASRLSIAADGPQAEVYRTSPVEMWRVIRTELRANKIVPGVVEGGGRPAGYFTGATGVTLFRGDAWPDQYKGYAIVGDVGSNLVHRKHLLEEGIRYQGVRVDEKSEFLTSNDIWFRPVQYSNAPDGSLYIADMYREVIEHPKSLPPMIKKHLDLTSGRDRGRIYRILGQDAKRRSVPKLSQKSPAELVELLDHPNAWHRETAARLIYERQDESISPRLAELAESAKTALGRLHALYALDGLGRLTPEVLLSALEDDQPRVRQHAVRLAEPFFAKSSALRQKAAALAGDDSARVRYQLAFSLGEFPVAEKIEPLVTIAKTDGAEPYVRAAIQSSLHAGAGRFLETLLTAADKPAPGASSLVAPLAAQIGKQQSGDDIGVLVSFLPQVQKQRPEAFQQVVQALDAPADSRLATQLAAATKGGSAAVIEMMVKDAVAVLDDPNAKPPARIEALKVLRFGQFKADRFAPLLEPSQPLDLQQAALAVLGQFDSPQVADLVIGQWQGLGPRLRPIALGMLTSRAAWRDRFFAAVEGGQIPFADLDLPRLAELKPLLSAEQAARVDALMKSDPRSDRAAIVEKYRPALTMSGDVAKGKQVFVKNCAACHQLEGQGHPIGPNLAAMNNRGAEAILVNVLEPNREVNPQYLSYLCQTVDGRTLSGMIANETSTSITLVQAENKAETILRIDIDQLRSTGASLMPEGLEKVIDQQAMADLIAYLMQKK